MKDGTGQQPGQDNKKKKNNKLCQAVQKKWETQKPVHQVQLSVRAAVGLW